MFSVFFCVETVEKLNIIYEYQWSMAIFRYLSSVECNAGEDGPSAREPEPGLCSAH